MLSWLTKNPAKSIKGIMRTGVRVTANYLSEKVVLMMSEQLPAAAQSRIKIATIKLEKKVTKEREGVPENSTKSNSEVNDSSKYNRSQDTSWDLRNNFSKEIGTDTVHVIVDFSKENRSFIREYKNDVLNRVE